MEQTTQSYKQKYDEYIKSQEWAEIKNDLYEIRGKRCERCGSKKFLQVHHKTYERVFKEEPGDLEILCGGCHQNEHGLLAKKPINDKKNVKNHHTQFKSGLVITPLSKDELAAGLIIVTMEIMESGMSSNGGWNNAQLKLMGAKIPLQKGWMKGIIGGRVDQLTLEKFVSLKDNHLSEAKINIKHTPLETGKTDVSRMAEKYAKLTKGNWTDRYHAYIKGFEDAMKLRQVTQK